MALDPRYFEGFGPLPDKGRLVSCLLRDGRALIGTVDLVFLAMDTPCIKVRTAQGVKPVFTEFGDRWWYETDPEVIAVWAALVAGSCESATRDH